MYDRFPKHNPRRRQTAKLFTGLLVILAGVVILLKQLSFPIPEFILSWKVLLIAIGLIMLVKHGFQKKSAYILIIVGSLFILNDFYPQYVEVKWLIPFAIIAFGIGIIFKSSSSRKHFKHKKCREEFERDPSLANDPDFIVSKAVFGGDTKNIVTKNFKGAEIAAIFGGIELNMLQCDFEGTATMELTAAFGGITLIVPDSWKIVSEVDTIFGGTEDKRLNKDLHELSEKTLVIKGNCVFGGIEITNYR
ncbi:MAG: hypothetical protein EP338_01040 [Bacteroidetes bacterium]|nr:MAG: hypothetical protein EP338_01040 [Bacteroidota bacterium]